MGSDTLRILIVDDHALVREGLARILESAEPPARVAQAGSGDEALAWLAGHPADLLITDLTMPGLSGFELVRRVRQDHPGLRVVVLSMHAEQPYVMRAIKAGANAYVTKDQASNELLTAVVSVMHGNGYLSPAVAAGLVQQFAQAGAQPPHARLTERELEILRRLVAGQRPGAIAQALNLSPKTVSTHKRRVHDKLGLPSTAALVRYGIEQGLGPEDEVALST